MHEISYFAGCLNHAMPSFARTLNNISVDLVFGLLQCISDKVEFNANNDCLTVSQMQKMFVCLFELMLYVPVNSNGHVGTLPPFYGTFTQH